MLASALSAVEPDAKKNSSKETKIQLKIMFIAGMKLFLLEPQPIQVPAKIHRRKNRRIRKKFLKRYGTKTEFKYLFPVDRIMQIGDTFHAYNPTYTQLIAEAMAIAKKNPSPFGNLF